MSVSTTFDAVRDILQSQFKVEPALIDSALPLSDLGLDSLSLVEFVFMLEDRFGLRIPEERLDPRRANLTLAQLCQTIEEALRPSVPNAA